MPFPNTESVRKATKVTVHYGTKVPYSGKFSNRFNFRLIVDCSNYTKIKPVRKFPRIRHDLARPGIYLFRPITNSKRAGEALRRTGKILPQGAVQGKTASTGV